MATYHIVWVKFAEGVPGERVNDHLDALRAMSSEIPGIEALACGANFTDRANGYTHGLVVTLRDRQGLADYIKHPYHVETASALRQDAQLLVLDFDD